MTIYRYAEMRGVDPRAIRTAIAAGTIVPDANGRVVSEQADAEWYEAHKARLNGSKRNETQIGQLLRAKVTAGATKAELARHRLNDARASHVDRQAVLVEGESEAVVILARLRSLPERRAAELAEALQVEPEAARMVLSRLVEAVLGELGDLGAVGRMVEAA